MLQQFLEPYLSTFQKKKGSNQETTHLFNPRMPMSFFVQGNWQLATTPPHRINQLNLPQKKSQIPQGM